MSEFDDAHAFVDGFFAALATRVPQSASLKSSHDVVESCLRLGESIGWEHNPNRGGKHHARFSCTCGIHNQSS